MRSTRSSWVCSMSNLELIERLCSLLDTAQGIIREQAGLLTQHGIESNDGGLEDGRLSLLEEIEGRI